MTSEQKRHSKPKSFKRLNRDQQIDYMRNWFSERYEDPAQRTPYDSGEGGYIYIYGGPFDTEDILRNNFEEDAKPGVIDELVDELNYYCTDWTHAPSQDDYDFLSEFDQFAKDFEISFRLKNSLKSVSKLVAHSKDFDQQERKFSNMMNFNFCITLLEAYLSEVFTRAVFSSQKTKTQFLKKDLNLGPSKILIGDIFETLDNIDNKIKMQISKTSFHNLSQMKSMFEAILEIDIGDIAGLIKYVEKRHDFVHRGGKTTEGKTVETNEKEIGQLIKRIEKFVVNIDTKLTEKGFLKDIPR